MSGIPKVGRDVMDCGGNPARRAGAATALGEARTRPGGGLHRGPESSQLTDLITMVTGSVSEGRGSDGTAARWDLAIVDGVPPHDVRDLFLAHGIPPNPRPLDVTEAAEGG